ncbi:MAG TPA: NADH-quinone oxidoreductase subunit L [Anaerolineaceae bacterium]|nr:NADH-quinone oxidoreductase subunit L [Anaerolineaceae bacterium]
MIQIEPLVILTILLAWVGAVVVWLIGDKNEKLQHLFAVVFSITAALSSIAMLFVYKSGTILSFPIGTAFGDFSFVTDGLGLFLSVVATVIGCLAIIFSVDYMKGSPQLGRYYAFVLFFIGAMVGLVLTSNLFLMFVFWEITALCSYALISFYNDDPKAVAGGMKALIITQIGGIGLLLGAALLYAYSGSFDINIFISNPSLIPSQVLVVMAFGFLIAAAAKSAQFPFQTWLPDAMEAPSPISALIHAATMVNAGVYLLARFYPAFKDVPGWTMSVMIVGMLSALMAALMALAANDLKRVLAYSTVSQLGYMVYAVGAGGLLASQFHLFSHSIFKALLFLAAGAIIHSVGTRDMREMGGLGKELPFARTVFIIGSLALAGIPILNGFWSKELILEAGLEHGNPIWLYVIMLLVAGITALYTMRCVWMVFFGEKREGLHIHPVGRNMKIALFPLAIGALTSWLLIGPFSKMMSNTLPVHDFHELSLVEMFNHVILAPATWIAVAIVLLGIMTWFGRESLGKFANILRPVTDLSRASFGFEAINKFIVSGTNIFGENLRTTQTGKLNWNIFFLLIGLIVVFAVLIIGA